MTKHRNTRRLIPCLVLVTFALLLTSNSATAQPSLASPAGFFDWGLKLPERAIPRRVSQGGVRIPAGQPFVFADLQGPGCIRRLWMTGVQPGRQYTIRIFFDGHETPHVEAPLSDFFGVMHNLAARNEPYRLDTPFLAVKPKNGFTCYLPMPFAKSARIELTREAAADELADSDVFYGIVDWHDYPDEVLKEPLRLCARWRRESPVRDYADDFILLDADGPGRLVGFVYGVDMLQSRQQMRWSHAGADNIYIDGDTHQPAFLRGIGGEDTFGTSFGGNEYQAQTSLFSDMPFYVQKDAAGDQQKLAGYRFFAHDSIVFTKGIHVRFGARAHDIASTVYWYAPAVRPYYKMPPLKQRLPGSEVRRGDYDLPLPDAGGWWITGPLSLTDRELPPATGFDPAKPWKDRSWKKVDSLRGFVEFNHVLRPEPSNKNSPTMVDAAAVARCTLESPSAATGTLTLGWDDQLIIRINDGEPIDLGTQPYLKPREIKMPLVAGRNTVTVWLSNTTGMTRGAWNFSFRAATADGVELRPKVDASAGRRP